MREWLRQRLAGLRAPAGGPVPWRAMAGAVLAVCAPLAAGLAAGLPVPGVLAGLGGLLAVLVDPGGPYPARARRFLVAGSAGGALGIVTGGLIHGHGWLTVLALMAVAGVSSLLSAAGSVASATGLQLLVYVSLGQGPLGTLRPWWLAPVAVIAGAGWAALLLVPGWLAAPRAPEQRSVAAAYRALAAALRAIGTDELPARRRAVTAAFNSAHDALLARRAGTEGRDRGQVRLAALLGQAYSLAEAAAAVAAAGRRPPPPVPAMLDAAAQAIAAGGPAPALPPFPAATPAERALREELAGLAGLLSGRQAAVAGGGQAASVTAAAPARALAAERAARGAGLARKRDVVRRAVGGRFTLIFAARVMAAIGVAGALAGALPLPRSYWVLLTVAIVLRPDFGSVLARGLQRAAGTLAGALIGGVILVAVPYGLPLVGPCALLAALLPYGKSRNFGLFSAFMTPLVVVLIDLLARAGWPLAEARLIDTLLGCAVALGVGYLPWPQSWHAHLPERFAAAAGSVARYTGQALAGGRPPARSGLRRQAFRELSDLRAEFQRMMAEPPAVRRRAIDWWPALLSLENVMDKVTALAVRIDQGAQAPTAEQVRRLTAALDGIAGSAATGGVPAVPPALPAHADGSGLTREVAAAVRDARRAVAAGSGG